MAKENQSTICVKHLLGEKRTVLVPRHVAVFNGFSLCPACVNEIAEYQAKQAESQAAAMQQLEKDGTAPLVEGTNETEQTEASGLVVGGETEPPATVPEVQPAST